MLPAPAGELVNRGNALARVGRLDEAAECYDGALALDPRCAEAHNNKGNVLFEQGRPAEALGSYQRAIALKPGYAQAHANAGDALLGLGRATEAVATYRRALEIEPGSEAIYGNLGNALADLGRIEEARSAYRMALELNPTSAEAHNNMGCLERGCGRLDEAVACYGRALALKPDFVEAHGNLALTQRLGSHAKEAQSNCLRALALRPDFAPALVVLAETHADQGEFVEAERLFRRAIAIDADSPEAWAGITRVRKMTRDDSDSEWLNQAQRVATLPLPPRKEAYVRFAMGKYFDDLGEFELAFSNYRRANELKKRCRPTHDREAVVRAVDRMIEHQQDALLARVRRAAIETERPTFVVGMLRSGTTLAEQILASHPAVFGAGELPYWSEAGRDLSRLETLANDYVRALADLAPDALRVVDKMPANFLALGLIQAALPNARVIHLQRHPLDTCLSIYFQHFETAIDFTNDLEDLASYYRQYLRIMEHWRSTLPAGTVLDVPYEALVRDPERWSRRMLQHIGLPWDERCIDFHLTERTVITASKWQVRQALNPASIGRWHNYEKHLTPLLALSPIAPAEANAS